MQRREYNMSVKKCKVLCPYTNSFQLFKVSIYGKFHAYAFHKAFYFIMYSLINKGKDQTIDTPPN
jgi:hypothetical protein